MEAQIHFAINVDKSLDFGFYSERPALILWLRLSRQNSQSCSLNMRRKSLYVAIAFILFTSLQASAQTVERLCDTAYEDCRAPLWSLIDNETQGIDISYWFMQ